MSEAYYRKWRPLAWDSVIGQDHVTTTIQNAITQDRIAHAYLFSGPRGTGKTSTARIVAKAVNCLSEKIGNRPCNECEHCRAINTGRFLDLIEIDAASNTSVDDVRALREKINFSPTQGKFKVYIIDEVHMLSNAAFNALLKTLEEPPAHAIFILATTEVHKIPPTVLSRCQRHEFRRIPINSIQANLKTIAEKEKIEIDPAALTEIARQATGSMRDAVSLLDQLASTGKKVTLPYAKDVLGTAGNQRVLDLATALLARDSGEGISIINKALDSGTDPRQFGRQVVNTLRSLLMVKIGSTDLSEFSREENEIYKDLGQKFSFEKLLTAIEAFDRSVSTTSLGWHQSLHLELAYLHAISEKNKDQKEHAENAANSIYETKLVSRKKKQSKEPKVVGGKTSTPSHTSASEKEDKKPVVQESVPPKNVNVEKDGIQAYWNDIKSAARAISPQTSALLNSCKSVKMHNGKVVLSFSSSVLQSKMEGGSNMDFSRKAVRKVIGKDLDIVCEVLGASSDTGSMNSNLDKDGMIGEALSLGGKITKEEKSAKGEEDDE